MKDAETNALEEIVPPRAERDENGVDRTLIRSSLRRTPAECLEILEELLDLTQSARRVDGSVR